MFNVREGCYHCPMEPFGCTVTTLILSYFKSFVANLKISLSPPLFMQLHVFGENNYCIINQTFLACSRSCFNSFFFSHRYMMLINGKNEVFMIDRDNSVFHIANLEFPFRKDPSTHLANTLLDGVSHSYLLLSLFKAACSFGAAYRFRLLSCLSSRVSHVPPLMHIHSDNGLSSLG